MNSLIQQDSMLIGSADAVAELEKKTHARLLVFSDSHGAIDIVKKIIMQFGADADALVFCGDGFCDVAACIEEAFSDDKLKERLPPVIAAVRGNGDADSYVIANEDDAEEDSGVQKKVFSAQRLQFIAAGRNILVIHGHRHGVDWGTETLSSAAYTMDADIVFFGHTHRLFWEEHGGTLILNPGSCVNPRNRFPPSFALVSFPGDTERFSIEFFGIREGLFGSVDIMPLAL
ncbi:YfcE family phosphodiesterase [Treponema sp. OMZ 840]|uniref:YfcE family phosphodiesterase n=1 Tax=Treponema sp. OMZ 840 TaxID=244313 RepID=UPI003D8BFD75